MKTLLAEVQWSNVTADCTVQYIVQQYTVKGWDIQGRCAVRGSCVYDSAVVCAQARFSSGCGAGARAYCQCYGYGDTLDWSERNIISDIDTG